ncbi:MAG: phytanoyl-CoA dioxygenase, partial [Caldilineaceae bacterium]|nr:phytanoyl-CoA dioxygenase [Caldilineaceae bacterium]
MMQVRFGYRDVIYPSQEMGELRDSRDLLDDVVGLRARMAEEGYLLLRGLIDREKVLTARRTVMEHIAAQDALT